MTRRPDTPEPPKRLRAADVIDKLLEKNHVERRPSVALERSAAPGSRGFVKITVDVPVCDEFPTLEEAVAAAQTTYDALAADYPPPEPEAK